jgi:hypothetical protein
MKNFKVQISGRLFYSGDHDVSAELAEQLRKKEKEFPPLRIKMEQTRDGEYWAALECMRKASALCYGPTEMEQIRGEIWRIERTMKEPLNAHNKQRQKLLAELDQATQPLRNEIIAFLDRLVEEARSLQFMKIVGKENRLFDLGDRGETDRVMRKVSDNSFQVEKIVTLLCSFKTEVRQMSLLSSDEILKKVEAFEEEVNAVDIFAAEEKEISPGAWRDLQSEGVHGQR